MRTNFFRRSLAMALVLMLTLSVCMLPAFAEEADPLAIRDNLYNADGTVKVKLSAPVTDYETAFTITGPDGQIAISSVKEEKHNTYILTLGEKLDLKLEYTLSCKDISSKLYTPSWYSSAEFEELYTYEGNDLGSTWTKEKTSFRLWAPTATAVTINLYKSGTAGTDDLIETIPMTADVKGTWIAEKAGDQNGVYYTYSVTVDGKTNEACDPYARATGVNGLRAMVIDLDSTNPDGWDTDKDPHYNGSITDAIIYELHVRDLSIDKSSGIKDEWKGKYLGLTQTGTVNSHGQATGLDYIKSLGITHIHLLPVYDYASVDEAHPEYNQFNWGYDPLNYNVPEGSYSTDAFKGEVRVQEFKQMVKSLHDNGISVIMDVVYNHVYNDKTFCFNQIVPGYFSRYSPKGSSINDSGCGNTTASERSMVKKYIIDSVKYWAEEYHIDGFRFDLVGLIDTETINDLVAQVSKDHPNVFFYGEGWDMTSYVTKDGYTMATQANAKLTPGFAYFSNTIRDAIRGPMGTDSAGGYLDNQGGYAPPIKYGFMGAPTWCKSPTQTINYASCHDNLSLFDKITLSTSKLTEADRLKMNNLSAAIVLTSQGTPLFQAGEEILRSKPDGKGGYDHNSYKSPDSINSIKWDNLADEAYSNSFAYYQGLIAFRKAHPILRLTSAEAVNAAVVPMEGLASNVNAFHIKGGDMDDDLFVIFNPRKETTTVTLPEGTWDVQIDGVNAGTTVLRSVEGSVTVDAISAMVLVKAQPVAPQSIAWLYVAIGAGVLVLAGAIVAVVVTKKRKK